jgi:hypothetical protein
MPGAGHCQILILEKRLVSHSRKAAVVACVPDAVVACVPDEVATRRGVRASCLGLSGPFPHNLIAASSLTPSSLTRIDQQTSPDGLLDHLLDRLFDVLVICE